jgi:peptidoglycan/LPS O-acetylase OafA/YrhL
MQPYLSGLAKFRGVAALLVTFNHAMLMALTFGMPINPNNTPNYYWDSFGALGVDFFLVISGCCAAFKVNAMFGQPSAGAKFLAQRLLRIFPLYWLAFALFYLSCWYCLPSVLTDPSKSIWQSLFLIPQPQAFLWGLLLVMAWGICLELLWVGIAALSLSLSRKRCSVVLLVSTLSLVLLVLAKLAPTTPGAQFWGNGLLLELLAGWLLGWCFVFGDSGVLSASWRRLLQRQDWSDLALFGALLLLISVLSGASVMVDAPKVTQADGDYLRALLWGGPACFILTAILLNAHRLRAASELTAFTASEPRTGGWLNGSFEKLGRQSYSLFAVHMPIQIIIGYWFQRLAWVSLTGYLLMVMILSIAAAEICYRWIETPLRRQLSRLI